MNEGFLLVITGPTGSGKDALIKELLKDYPKLSRIVTCTTRTKRPGEVDGKDYLFLNLATFETFRSQKKFIETNFYGGHFYGTLKSALMRVLKGESLIWRIDPSRAAEVNELFMRSFEEDSAKFLIKHTLVIFIDVESKKILEKRLRKRNMNQKEIEDRIETDWPYRESFLNRIVNKEGQLSETLTQMKNLINKF